MFSTLGPSLKRRVHWMPYIACSIAPIASIACLKQSPALYDPATLNLNILHEYILPSFLPHIP